MVAECANSCKFQGISILEEMVKNTPELTDLLPIAKFFVNGRYKSDEKITFIILDFLGCASQSTLKIPIEILEASFFCSSTSSFGMLYKAL